MKDKEFHLTHRPVRETIIPYSEHSKSDFDFIGCCIKNTTTKYEPLGTIEEELTKALAEQRKPYRDSVIQECIDVIFKEVKQRYMYHNEGMTEEFIAGHYAGALMCCVKIREHFNLNHDLTE